MCFEYVVNTYGVPACLGRVVSYNGRSGVITSAMGPYIGVTFDDEHPGSVSPFHPRTEGLEYLGMGKIRKMSRSQKRYQEYIESDSGQTFAEWMGFKR